MSDFDTRPGDEIPQLGEDGDIAGPDLAEEDVSVDDIHERDESELSPDGGRSS